MEARTESSPSARSSGLAAEARVGAGGRVRRRRWGLGIAAAAIVGLAVGMLLHSGEVDRALREFTLPLRHEDIIRQQAAEKGVDASLIAAVIYAESRFQDQTSHAGARGLMQITPAPRTTSSASAAAPPSGSRTSPTRNQHRYGTFYLRELLQRYDGNEVAALAAYNAGPGNADAWGGSSMSINDIPTAETRGYVDEVLDKQHDYRDNYASELGYGTKRRG